MAKGISINIGVNTINSSFYNLILDNGLSLGYLKSSANDAVQLSVRFKNIDFEIFPKRDSVSDFPKFAEDPQYTTKVKVNPVLKAISKFSNKGDSALQEGDFLLITFSGHGMKIPQLTPTDINDVDKVIPAEASWCFYDRPLLDDELVDVLSDFAENVKIVIISDSCHSGFVIDRGYFGLLGININGINLEVLEKAVLKAKGYKIPDINQSENLELKNTITILNDNVKIRKENIEKFQEKMFLERISKPFTDVLIKEGLQKTQIDNILENLNAEQLNKSLNFSNSNKLLSNSLKNNNNFLKKLSKIKLADKTFEEFNTKLDLLLQDDLILDIKKLDQIPLIQDVKCISKANSEQICIKNRVEFENFRKVARQNIKVKKDKLAIGEKLIKAKVIFLSACQNEESTIAGCDKQYNSEYTKAILDIWKDNNGNNLGGSYKDFETALETYFNKTSWKNECSPQYYTQIQKPLINTNDNNFLDEKPMFKIEP